MIELQDPKTFAYKVIKDDKEKIYDIPEDTVDTFLKDNPEAKLFEQSEVKENGVVGTDAPVTPEKDTASKSVAGSSEFTRDKLDLNLKPVTLLETDPEGKKFVTDFENAIQFSDAENLLFEREEDTIDENGKKIQGGYTIPVDFTPYEEVVKSKVTFSKTGKILNIEKGETKTVVPYQKELDEATNMLTNPNKYGLTWKPIENPNTEQVQALASYMIKTKEKSALLKKKTQDYLQTLTNKEREALAPYEANRYIKNKAEFDKLQQEEDVLYDKYTKSASFINLKNITEKINDPDYKFDVEGLGDIEVVEILQKRIEDMGDPSALFTESSVKLYNNLIDKYNEEVAKVKTVKLENGKVIPIATFNLLKDLQDENKNVFNTLSDIEKEKEDLPIDIKTSEELLGYLKLNYSEIEKFGTKIRNIFGVLPLNVITGGLGLASDVTLGLAELGLEKTGLVEEGTIDAVSKMDSVGMSANPFLAIEKLRGFKNWLNSSMEKEYQDKYVGDITLEEGFSSGTNFGKFFTQELIGQSGTLAMLYYGGYGLGMTGVGLDSYQQQMSAMFDEDKMPGAEKTSRLEKLAVSAGYAALEVSLGALPTLKILSKGKQVVDDVLEAGTRTLFNKGVGDYMLMGIKATGYGAALEAPTEGLTVLGQNAIDIVRGVKTSNQIMENVDHATVVGGMIGSVLSASPYAVGATYSLFSDYNSYEGYRKNLKEVTNLHKQTVEMDKRTTEYKIIKKQIDNLEAKNDIILENVESKITNKLTKEGFYAFRNATARQEQIRNQAKEIDEKYKANKITKENRETTLKSLLQEFQRLELARRDFKESFTMNIGLLSQEEQVKYEQAARLNLESTGKDFTNQDVRVEAEKIWQEETFDKNSEKDYLTIKRFNKSGINTSYAMSNSNSESIQKFKEALDARVTDTNHPMDEAEAKKLLNEFKTGINNGTLNGVNLLTFDKDGKRVYDIIVDRTNAIKNGKTSTGIHEMGHTLFAETISTNSDAFKLVALNVLGWLKINNKKAYTRIMERVKNESNYDEVLTNFLEEVPRMQLEAKNNKGLLAILSQGLPDAISDATSGSSNFNLKGGLDTIDFLTTLANKLKTGKLTIAEIKQLKKGVELEDNVDLVEETTETKVSESKTIVAENKRLSEQLKTATAQEAIDIKNDLALNNEGIVNDFVNSKFKSGLGITKEEFKSGVQEEVLVYLNKTYDPSKGEYGAYIREGLFGGGKFGGGRLGNILKRLGQEGDLFTKEIDDRTTPETLDTTTEETTERVEEKPTKAKESLRKKIKLDEATTQKVVDAVTKTFGTKLPPVDSPQFKKALQKGFRTELKTIMAKDVLGSRAAYETFLRDNFENIYEAIPQEIINKRFRPFAEDTGKREKTKEGKKIFKKKEITKAEFIKYFLGRDVGTSTKGTRKDALAEALAEEFAFDATMETIQKPEVIEKREFVDKTQTTEKVSKAIKRPVGLKFSKSIAELKLPYKQDFYQKLPEIGKAIEASNVNFKDKNSWKEIKSIISPILGNNFPKLNELSKDLQKYIKQYSEVKENYKNLNTLPEQSLDEFLFNETQAAETNTNIIKLLELGNVKMTTLFNNVDNIIKQRLFAKELGNHLINTGMKPAEVAKLFVSYYKGMYATSSKIGDGGIVVDKQGQVVKGSEKNIGTPRYQSFSNVNDFVNNVIKQIKGLENIQLTASGQIKNKQNIGGVIVDFNLFSETSKSAIQDKDFAGRKKQAKEARKSIDLMMSFMVDKVLDKKSIYTKEDLAMLMASMKSNMQGPIKRAANLKYIYEGKKVNVKDLRYEHMIPTNYVVLKLVDFYMNNKGSIRNSKVDELFEQYTVAVIPKEMDKVLEKMKLVDVMPANYFDGDPSYKRYYNIKTFGAPGIVAIKSIDPKDKGKVIGEKWVAAEKSKQKAKVYNEKILPPVINTKFSKSTTNQEVLNEMENLDTKAQEARIKFSKSKDLNRDFNEIIERATGISKEKQYGKTKARAVGADKGKFNLLGIPPSAQDFVGLTRYFAGKGKQGDETIAWVKENFLDPFARANIDISNARVALANDFKALKKLLGVSPKDLNKKITGEPYTVGNAVRVYTWAQQGMTIPGLSKTDQKILEDYVAADENLVTFANELIAINKDNGYPKPTDGWLAGTITTDLLSGLNTVVRAKYLKQWQNNVDEVFNETNMNKLEAAYGKGYRDALENMLGRMKTGSNRGFKGDTLTGRFIDWINNSVGAIMFFNMRSAVLQTISAVNFVNWSDNNPLKAAAAFANQPQYWSDVMKLMNSDYLVERRNGLKINVSEADIAEIAAESKNKAKAFISKILKLGFLPTQIADSFAIASGGATFYRNRLKSLLKDGMSQSEAEAQAFQDFREVAEESQQSSRPDRISQQQAGPMGRIILAFANTPAQYARLMQKAASDLKNGRGDAKTNISKILYYGAIQNVIFNALQQALFAMAFGDEEPDEEKLNKKYTGIANGMADSLLRGVGFHGAAISTLKNVIMKLAEGKEAQDAAIELLDISPPISSKIGKLKSAGRTWDWNKKEIREKGWSLDNPAYLAAGQVISAATNVPLDRGIRKLQNLKDASDAENEEWMRVANALGWAKWELEWQKDKPKKKKATTKSRSRSRSRSSSRAKSRNKKR